MNSLSVGRAGDRCRVFPMLFTALRTRPEIEASSTVSHLESLITRMNVSFVLNGDARSGRTSRSHAPSDKCSRHAPLLPFFRVSFRHTHCPRSSKASIRLSTRLAAACSMVCRNQTYPRASWSPSNLQESGRSRTPRWPAPVVGA